MSTANRRISRLALSQDSRDQSTLSRAIPRHQIRLLLRWPSSLSTYLPIILICLPVEGQMLQMGRPIKEVTMPSFRAHEQLLLGLETVGPKSYPLHNIHLALPAVTG